MDKMRQAHRILARVGLRHANMQEALAEAYAKATNQDKGDVLEQLRELERRGR